MGDSKKMKISQRKAVSSDDDSRSMNVAETTVAPPKKYKRKKTAAATTNCTNSDAPKTKPIAVGRITKALEPKPTTSPTTPIKNMQQNRISIKGTSKAKNSSILPPPPDGDISASSNSTTMRFWEHFLGTASPTPIREASTIANETTKLEKIQANSSVLDGVIPVSELFYRANDLVASSNRPTTSINTEDHDDDDDELPFSAEQSDSITVVNNSLTQKDNTSNIDLKRKKKKSKTIRTKVPDGSESTSGRGIETFVGGLPVRVDPPRRCIKLNYDKTAKDWVRRISLNTAQYGPLLLNSGRSISNKERGIYAEFFCQSGLKWDILPDDLRDIVETNRRATVPAGALATADSEGSGTMQTYKTNESDESFDIKGEFAFEIRVLRTELLACESNTDFLIFRDVIERAFRDVLAGAAAAFPDEANKFDVKIPSLTVRDIKSKISAVKAEFKATAVHEGMDTKLFRNLKRIGTALTTAIEEGKLAVAIASVALKESAWPKELRARIAEECLFRSDDEGETEEDETDESFEDETDDFLYVPSDEKLLLPSDLDVEKAIMDNQLRDGGLGGVFDDYLNFDENMAPFQGQLGPRLVDAVVERARMRVPRVIVIGDVHGCIDELKELLRRCDYRPGDLVLFLGDLVCKGPDSLSVVQLAREIGAIGVRGNHDFEIVRWHQAIQAGVDQPVFGSEHFYIATRLSQADLKWLYSLPWFISSPSLSALFVHAGFVSGIKLNKQNPRLMVNMRSILPDGTVTSRFFTNWPWARLWDGPYTVYFGHDADRGLQQWPNAVGLDTGCVYGGRLSAIILPERRIVSAPARKRYFRCRRRHFD